MASRQEDKKERAEAAARKVADELQDLNKGTNEKGSMMHEETPFDQGHDQRSSGVIGNIFKSVKETITGKAHDTSETTLRESEDVAAHKIHGASETTDQKASEAGQKMGEDSAAEKEKQAENSTVEKKATEYKDYAKDSLIGQSTKLRNKGEETKEATMKKTNGLKDYGAEKAGEYKDSVVDHKAKQMEHTMMEKADYIAEKAEEGKDTTFGKISELKDSAADAARRAVGFFTGTKEDAADAALRNEEPKELYEETEDNARKMMQELKLNEEGVQDEARQRAEADRETAAARGSAAKKNIYSAMGNLTGSIKEKLTMPSDIVEETRAARELGGPKRGMRTDVDERSPVARSGFVFTTAKDDTSS
ncbi:embryonic protein DC-8-like [Solanum tuberosum]|uniref:ECP63 protein n=1 Tax=Solanum tuberosum TaxID=4113 RepID=M1BVU1_SOLTU|nr:PREDICTED: embryonic protein DC-8-like [Solanum tuberosum]